MVGIAGQMMLPLKLPKYPRSRILECGNLVLNSLVIFQSVRPCFWTTSGVPTDRTGDAWTSFGRKGDMSG